MLTGQMTKCALICELYVDDFVFFRMSQDMKHMMTGGPTLKETRIVSSSYGNPSEGIIEAETYRGNDSFTFFIFTRLI